jgi:hypothetical protein
MKRLMALVSILVLAVPVLAGCGQGTEAAGDGFDELARFVPGDVPQITFLDLRPSGEMGENWAQLRAKLEAVPAAKSTLDSLLNGFALQDFGLDPFVAGPAANFYVNSTSYLLVQVNDLSAARDAVLLRDPQNLEWERENYKGRTLYHSSGRWVYGRREWLALTADDDLIVLVVDYNSDPIDELKALVDLPAEDSLASSSSWGTLRERLPQAPMGLAFFKVDDASQGSSAPAADASLGTALGQQIEALALAAIPEKNGMRIEIAGSGALRQDAPPEIRGLLTSPAIDAGSWTGLPSDTAIALVAHDTSIFWPVVKDIFNVRSLDLVRDALGLDLEADLFTAGGVLSGDFALGITPPLADQPISQGLTAGQLLFLGRDAMQAQMDGVQAVMESRGATFSSQQIEGVEVQTQLGTEPTGYAIAFGFDDRTFLLGTSPGIVGHSVVARRDGSGLVNSAAFQAVLGALPPDPNFVLYLNRTALTDLARANMSQEEYERNQELMALEPFEAISLGLRLRPEGLDGTIYFLAR